MDIFNPALARVDGFELKVLCQQCDATVPRMIGLCIGELLNLICKEVIDSFSKRKVFMAKATWIPPAQIS